MHNTFFLVDWLRLAVRGIYELVSRTSLQEGYAVFVAIVIATVALKGLTLFSDINMRKYSVKMQVLQPKIDKLKEKYGNDPRRMQEEQRKLMKDNGTSMMAGCWPMLLMLPIFFMFVAAFRTWSNERMLHLMLTLSQDTDTGVKLFESYRFLWIHNIWQPDNFIKISCFGQSVLPVPTAEEFFAKFSALKPGLDKLKLNPEYVALLQNLHFFEPDTMTVVADQTLFKEAYDNLMAPCMALWNGQANGYAILPLIAGGTSMLQSWLSQKAQPKPAEGQQQGMGKMMVYGMPLMFSLFCLGYEAAFAIYFIISNIIALIVTLTLNAVFKKQQTNQLEVVK
ncbi:MAG: YidC/Oxa1 family membrane protein insertase [Clostridiales bacterium]|nr:YidC/Oxa1 family membrane protein insertase [Clostridiales bacterium]